MNLSAETIGGGAVSKITLHGRLDTPGAGQIEIPFTANVVAPSRNAVVDLTGVTFVSSMGIHLLMTTARALALKKAKMVLFGAQPAVMASLEHVGLPDLIRVVADEAQALAALEAA
jgi:anti-anti-sigma factor